MLLLMLVGAGSQAPVVAGVRACGNIFYALVGNDDLSFSLVNPAQTDISLTTNATATEE